MGIVSVVRVNKKVGKRNCIYFLGCFWFVFYVFFMGLLVNRIKIKNVNLIIKLLWGKVLAVNIFIYY